MASFWKCMHSTVCEQLLTLSLELRDGGHESQPSFGTKLQPCREIFGKEGWRKEEKPATEERTFIVFNPLSSDITTKLACWKRVGLSTIHTLQIIHFYKANLQYQFKHASFRQLRRPNKQQTSS
uniref:Uncharacterized protein n=1 Tax=Parascaris univalens TaxID=6257 RepID=A0A915AG30_PARUN